MLVGALLSVCAGGWGSTLTGCPASLPEPAAQPRLAPPSATGWFYSDGARFDLGSGATDYFELALIEERVCFGPEHRKCVTYKPDAGWVAEGFGEDKSL